MANVFFYFMEKEYRIYKYPLQVTDKQTIKLPSKHKILCVQIQGNGPCIWAMVNPYAPEEELLIETIGTGHEISTELEIRRNYIGTYQLQRGALVFHVFQIY